MGARSCLSPPAGPPLRGLLAREARFSCGGRSRERRARLPWEEATGRVRGRPGLEISRAAEPRYLTRALVRSFLVLLVLSALRSAGPYLDGQARSSCTWDPASCPWA
jgi:hypothetical protein